MAKALNGPQSTALGVTDRLISPSEMRAFERAVARWVASMSKTNRCTIVALWQGTSMTPPFPDDGPYPSHVYVAFVRAEEASARDHSNPQAELSSRHVAERLGMTIDAVNQVARLRGIGRIVGTSRWYSLDDLEAIRRAYRPGGRPRARQYW